MLYLNNTCRKLYRYCDGYQNRKALLDYIEQGGLHTTKVQVSSALSRAGKYSGIACSVFWGIYLTYWVIAFLIMIIAVIGGLSSY